MSSISILELLLNKGADINKRDKSGDNALYYAGSSNADIEAIQKTINFLYCYGIALKVVVRKESVKQLGRGRRSELLIKFSITVE